MLKIIAIKKQTSIFLLVISFMVMFSLNLIAAQSQDQDKPKSPPEPALKISGQMKYKDKVVNVTVDIAKEFIGSYLLGPIGEFKLTADGKGEIQWVKEENGKRSLDPKTKESLRWGAVMKDGQLFLPISFSKKLSPKLYQHMILIVETLTSKKSYIYHLYVSENQVYAIDEEEHRWRHVKE
ncbi:MAG: hypothetical protein HQK77_06355 [Desulfobacterales bacterium]|nr:hypothetical protein [Desulfobacterales bacterium]